MKIPAGAVGSEINVLAEVVSPSHAARLAESGTEGQEPPTPAPSAEGQEQADEPTSPAAKAQSALSSTSMKPRMSYVLTGEPPAPKPGALATSAGSVAQQKRGGKRR